LQWITRSGASGGWAVRTIGPSPSLHRLRWGDARGAGRKQLFAAPLHGPGVKEPDWGGGPGVRILAYEVPERPGSDPWPSELVDEGLHAAHGLQLVDLDGDGRDEALMAAWEGVFVLRRDAAGHWSREQIGAGHREEGPSKGAGEVRLCRLSGGRR